MMSKEEKDKKEEKKKIFVTRLPKQWPWESTQREYNLLNFEKKNVDIGRTCIPFWESELKKLCDLGRSGKGPILPRSYAEGLIALENSSVTGKINKFKMMYPDCYYRDGDSNRFLININEFVRFIIFYNNLVLAAKEHGDKVRSMSNENALGAYLLLLRTLYTLISSDDQNKGKIKLDLMVIRLFGAELQILVQYIGQTENRRCLIANEMRKNGSYKLIKKYYDRLVMMLKQQHKW